MSDVFISYSRKDIAFARLLHQALKENGFETWIDWQDIPPSTDWLNEVYTAIEETDTFIFIISDTSVISEICQLEIEHARENNKRLIPIVIDSVEPGRVHPALAALNWIFARTDDEFQSAIQDLVAAIETDYEWARAHTRLQVRALEWEREGEDRSYLLRGSDLSQAEAWIADAAEKTPEPSLLQTRYIQTSRQEATRRQRNLLFGVGIALIISAVLGVLAFINGQRATSNAVSLSTQVVVAQEAEGTAQAEAFFRATQQVIAEEQRNLAEEQQRVAEARMLAAMALNHLESELDLALLLSVESVRTDRNHLTVGSLLSALETDAKLLRYFDFSFDYNMSLSPDGRTIVTSGDDGSIRFWDPNTGLQMGEPIPAHTSRIWDQEFAPDGSTLASVGWDATIRFWNLESREQVGPTLTCELCTNASYNAQGNLLATGIEVWDTESFEIVQRIPAEENPGFYKATFHPQESILAVWSLSDQVRVWDVALGEKLLEIPHGHGLVWDLTFSPDGEMLITGGQDGSIRFWDSHTGDLLNSFSEEEHDDVMGLAVTPNGRYMFSIHQDKSILLWNLDAMVRVGIFGTIGGSDPVVSQDGYFLVTSKGLWSIYKTLTSNIPFSGHRKRIIALGISPDARFLVSSSTDDSLRLWDTATGEMIGKPLVGHSEAIECLAFRPDGKVFASGGWDDTIITWDVASGEPIGDPIEIGTRLRELLYDPGGRFLVTMVIFLDMHAGTSTSKILIWDADTLEPMGEIEGMNTEMGAIAFSPDGNTLAIAEGRYDSPFYVIRLWDIQKEIQIGDLLLGHKRTINSMDFSPDGNLLVSTDEEGAIHFWNLETGEQSGDVILAGTDGNVSVRFVPNTTFVVMAGSNDDGLIRLLDSVTRQYVGGPISGSNARGLSIAFPSHVPLLGYEGHDAAIEALAVSADGSLLASGAEDGSLRLWSLDLEDWVERACLRAGRNLTQEEWNIYLPAKDYAPTCPLYPADNAP